MNFLNTLPDLTPVLFMLISMISFYMVRLVESETELGPLPFICSVFFTIVGAIFFLFGVADLIMFFGA